MAQTNSLKPMGASHILSSTGQEYSINTPSDVTAEWLANAVGVNSISSFEFARVGTGQMSDCYRLNVEYAQETNSPSSFVLKVASQDPKSFQTGESLGLYRREVFFYQQIAPLLEGLVPWAYSATYDDTQGSFAILLRDLSDAHCANDITGATLEQAKISLNLLGNIHAKMLHAGVEGYTWLKREQPMSQAVFQSFFDGFVARFRDVLTVEQLGVCSRLVSCYDAYKKQQAEVCTQGVIHGDFRLDNILFKAEQGNAIAVDWQTVQWAPILGDVAYFLGGSLPPDDRRAHFEELLLVYYDALGANPPMSLSKLRSDLRHESFFGIVMLICSCMMVKQTERGDAMFAAMLKRHCDFVIDLDAVAILPPATQPPVLQPLPTDEYLHPRGTEILFNESYYFDFVDPQQGVAGYVRLGITPNSGTGGWYLAVLTRRGQPLVSVMDYTAPTADATLQINGEHYKAGFQVIDPLKVFNITLEADAKLHADASSIFKGDDGEGKVKLSFNLSFRTDGTPYKYRVATRYEIPCLVDGTVSVDGETCKIVGKVGQRDHSWGVRNWWNMDWFWGGIHLDDGAHIHIIDLYIVGQSQMGIGYYQAPGEEVLELSAIDTIWNIDSTSNLVTGSTLQFTPHGKEKYSVKVEALDHGPLRLVSDEGKVALFDRAWCKCTLDDGRVGYGWLEWNRVQE